MFMTPSRDFVLYGLGYAFFTLLGTYFLVIQQRDLQLIVESEPHREMNFYHQKDISLTLQRFRRGLNSGPQQREPSAITIRPLKSSFCHKR